MKPTSSAVLYPDETLMRGIGWDFIYSRTSPYEIWIAQWTSHLTGLPDTIMVPSAAVAVFAPLNTNEWQGLLMKYPNRLLV